jgi:putative transposase
MNNRKVTYRLYPAAVQANALIEMLIVHQRIYNRALEERIRVYQEESSSLSFVDQCKRLTRWRRNCSSLSAINAQSLQVTLKRLDLAFQAFFRRIKLGQTPGFPRFKSKERFSGWGYKTHGDGFRFYEGDGLKHGKLKLAGVGMVKLRGKARTSGEIKRCEILHKQDKWYASVTLACQPKRKSGKKAVGLDWGVERFLTIHTHEGKTKEIDNPRHLRKNLPKLKLLQQAVSRKTNKSSHNRKKAVKKLVALHGKIANQRKDFIHQQSARLVKQCGLIACEALSVKNMTRSGGRYKRGLNREILSTAPRQFHSLLKFKAEEAGTIFVEIPTRQVKPSQTCYGCGNQSKKMLSERWHHCHCGISCPRDENAARVILNWAFEWASGRESAELGSHRPSMTLNQETPAIPLG